MMGASSTTAPASRNEDAAVLGGDANVAQPPAQRPTVDDDEDGDVVEDDEEVHDYAFASRYGSKSAPREKLQKHSFHANEAYQVIKDMRQLDQNPRMNLASFVTTWMEPEAEKALMEAFNVNFVDADQYRSCHEMENRCICMLADLYNAPDPKSAPGAACIGSSEAIMLSALSLKKRWMARRKAAGKDFANPNMVMGHHVQVCWEKFCRYFDVEARYVPLEVGEYTLNVAKAKELVDENTIGLVAILGSTYTGSYDDVKALDAVSDELRAETGWEVPVHVDAASGGFVAPFVEPELEWDFRLKNVVSINVSGHKYGLVYAGIGWCVFRDKEALDESLMFSTNYLGSAQPNITLNFSRGAANIVGQYYQFLRLGWNGYRTVMQNLGKMAKRLRKGIEKFDVFKVISEDNALPLVAFSLLPAKNDAGDDVDRIWNEFELSDKLRERGWMIPAYAMAPNAQTEMCLRVVVREDMSTSMLEGLLKDLEWAVSWLNTHFTFSTEEIHKFRERKLNLRLQSIVRGRVCS